MAVVLRRLRRFRLGRLNSAKSAPNWGVRAQYKTPLARGQSRRIGSSRNPEAPLRIAESASWHRRGGFAPFTSIARSSPEAATTSPTRGGGAHYDTPRIRGQTRRIFWESRDPPQNRRICFMAPTRWIFAGCSDFSGPPQKSAKKRPTWRMGSALRYSPDPRPIA